MKVISLSAAPSELIMPEAVFTPATTHNKRGPARSWKQKHLSSKPCVKMTHLYSQNQTVTVKGEAQTTEEMDPCNETWSS